MKKFSGLIVLFFCVIILFLSVAFAQIYKVGDKVEVEWNKRWYKAKVLEVKNEKYKIHYLGWSDSFDEWVGSNRIRTQNKVTKEKPKTK